MYFVEIKKQIFVVVKREAQWKKYIKFDFIL